MKTLFRILALAAVPLLITGQPSPATLAARRAAYLDAYRVWREADPNLEQQLTSAPRQQLIERIEHTGSAAAVYAAARRGYLDALVADCQRSVQWLESTSVNTNLDGFIGGAKAQQTFLAAQAAYLTKNIDSYSHDTDRGIVRLRLDLEKEKAALEAIDPTLSDRVKSLADLRAVETQAETSQKAVLAKYLETLAGLQQSAQDAAREADLWKTYYAGLKDSAQGPSGVKVAAEAPPESPPVAPPAAPLQTAPSPLRPAGNQAPESLPATPLPDIDRFLGGWTYPITNGLFFGREPDFVDLIVRQQNGMITGTLYARFKTPPGAPRDPMLHFDFSGKPSNSKTQVFDLVTNDGGRGTVELIPGPAVNLLEVNFRGAPQPDKVYQGDVILVRK